MRWSERESKVGGRLQTVFASDPEARQVMLHALEDQYTVWEVSFQSALTDAPVLIGGFEDLHWLFWSNPANHGLSRLQLDEAAFLYRLVKSLEAPRVAELGRFKGGTTLLLAAAGAHVLSVDSDVLEMIQTSIGGDQSGGPIYAASLLEVLRKYGLEAAVELVEGDTRCFKSGDACFDFVLFDASTGYEDVKAEFENWWPRIKPAGRALFRDGREPLLPEVGMFVDDLTNGRYRPSAGRAMRESGSPGAIVSFLKEDTKSKRGTGDGPTEE